MEHRSPKRRIAEEIPQEETDTDGKDRSRSDRHQEMNLDLELSLEEPESHYSLEVGLDNSGGSEGHCHAEHPDGLHPECPVTHRAFLGRFSAAGKVRHCKCDHREI